MFTGSQHAYRSYGGGWPCYQPCAPQIWTVYVPVVCSPAQFECCDRLKVPHDMDVQQSTTPQSALVGGSEDASLTLEYLVDSGAASPSVTLTTTTGSATSTWTDATPTVGYHVQEALLSVQPGTTITLAVNNVTARVRWCETICC